MRGRGQSDNNLAGTWAEVEPASMRFLAAAMSWRDRDWWRWRQALGLVLDPGNVELEWRHHKPGAQLQWEDVFVKNYGDQWKTEAALKSWKESLGRFVTQAYSLIHARVLEQRFQRRVAVKADGSDTRPAKRPRLVGRPVITWQLLPTAAIRLEFLGDSKLIVNWMRGVWDMKYKVYRNRVEQLSSQWDCACQQFFVAPPTDCADFHRHIFRDLNSEADAKANFGREHVNCSWSCPLSPNIFCCFRLYCDGSLKDGACGAGFIVYASAGPGTQDDNWIQLAWMSYRVEATSITAAELEAMAGAQAFICNLLRNPSQWQESFGKWRPNNY